LVKSPQPASGEDWTLVRNARQLLTLQGPSGPRGGPATELSIVSNGAVLIRNGVIEQVGSARRLENLAGARKAREIDATGKLVMPGFVDADVGLVTPAATRNARNELRDEATALRLMSRKRIIARAAATAAECARYGSLSIGAHTRYATDLQNIGKVLRTHQVLQLKPLRIRSIFSSVFENTSAKSPLETMEILVNKWLPAVRARKLSGLVEFAIAEPENGSSTPSISQAAERARLRTAAVAAASLGYAIRLRSTSSLEPPELQLALSAGATGIIAPMDRRNSFFGPLSAIGCVRVIPASEAFDNPQASTFVRNSINEGACIALTSSYRAQGTSTMNMQYLLHLGVHSLGLTEEEAILATTWNAACSLRLSHVTGSLEPGKPADLLILDVPDYRELARRAGHHDASIVMRAGQVIYRNAPLSVN
jgi:imidazolonepropionase